MEGGEKNMRDFVYENCELVKESGRFVTVWLKTHRNSCLECGADKTKCGFYKELAAKKVIEEEVDSTVKS